MAEPNDKKEEIEVIEEQDGSATVDLPEDMVEDKQDLSKNSDEDENAPDPNDNEELRQAKRNRRRAKKDLIRKTNQEKDVRLSQLQRENEQMRRDIEQLKRSTKSEQLVRIDKHLEDAGVRLEYAKMKISEATQNQDGEAMVEAQTLMQTARDELRQLNGMRAQADAELKKPQQQNVDPEISRLASLWIRRNSWYNPQGMDADSRVAKKIDELMVTQGWNPSDPDYWDELDSRLQKELPHRYNEGNDDDSRDVRRPRNVVGSSGREASAAYGGVNRNQFLLSPDRVKAMKEAGAWDNPVRKKKMIEQFMAYDRANGNRN
jgi:hypothetical protein